MIEYPLRLPDDIMEQARRAANEDKVSVNQMLVAIIAEGLGHREGLKMMRERAARADVGAALATLDSVPDVPPEAGDEMPETASAANPGSA